MASQENRPNRPSPPPAWVNKMMAWLLRSPLHGIVSKSIMPISVTGRKSGKKYRLPVSHVRDGDMILCSTERDNRNWWRNLRGGAEVTLLIRREELRGFATAIVDDREAIAHGIERMLTIVPRDAKYYDVRLDDQKRPLLEDIARAAQRRVIVEIVI